jgi:hypothetical protein
LILGPLPKSNGFQNFGIKFFGVRAPNFFPKK